MLSIQQLWRSNGSEHLAIYSLATLANFLLSVPQYIAVNTALELAIIPKGTTMSLIAEYGSSTGLVLDFLRSGLIFQGVIAVLVIGVAEAARGPAWSSRQEWLSIQSYHQRGATKDWSVKSKRVRRFGRSRRSCRRNICRFHCPREWLLYSNPGGLVSRRWSP